MPQALIEQVVRQDLRKEAVLRKVYGMEITPAMVAAEVERINTTTRAPEVLAEIKHALADDAARFAATMARPILVERELRQRFDNDDKLHVAQRREADAARASLLAKIPVPNMHEVTWQLTARPADDKPAPSAAPTTPTQAKAKSSAYTNEATAQVAQSLTPPEKAAPGKDKHYFEDLDPEVQKVLRVQLQKPGDVSAVIENPFVPSRCSPPDRLEKSMAGDARLRHRWRHDAVATEAANKGTGVRDDHGGAGRGFGCDIREFLP